MEKARINLCSGRIEKPVGAVLRIRDESRLHCLVFGFQQEFGNHSMTWSYPFGTHNRPMAGMIRR